MSRMATKRDVDVDVVGEKTEVVSVCDARSCVRCTRYFNITGSRFGRPFGVSEPSLSGGIPGRPSRVTWFIHIFNFLVEDPLFSCRPVHVYSRCTRCTRSASRQNISGYGRQVKTLVASFYRTIDMIFGQ